jgi:hypothetical protein
MCNVDRQDEPRKPFSLSHPQPRMPSSSARRLRLPFTVSSSVARSSCVESIRIGGSRYYCLAVASTIRWDGRGVPSSPHLTCRYESPFEYVRLVLIAGGSIGYRLSCAAAPVPLSPATRKALRSMPRDEFSMDESPVHLGTLPAGTNAPFHLVHLALIVRV